MVKATILTSFICIFSLLLQPVNASTNIGGQSAHLSHSTPGPSHQNGKKYSLKKQVIKKILAKYNSPLADSTDAFINACEKYEFDCYLLPSITGLESYFGTYIHPGSHNPFGWGGGYIMFRDWNECIDAVGKGLQENYINKGAGTIYQIGPIYAESPTWAVRVTYFYNQFMEEERKQQLYFSSNTVEL